LGYLTVEHETVPHHDRSHFSVLLRSSSAKEAAYLREPPDRAATSGKKEELSDWLEDYADEMIGPMRHLPSVATQQPSKSAYGTDSSAGEDCGLNAGGNEPRT
jgi:hypothetical protein